MAALLKDQLAGTKTYNTYGSDSETDKERKVPLAPISQIASDITSNLPDALMGIIYYIGPSNKQNTGYWIVGINLNAVKCDYIVNRTNILNPMI